MSETHAPSSSIYVASLASLRAYVEAEAFRGYDPYDTLKTPIPLRRLGRWAPVLAIQVQKRNPVNIRPLLGIKKERNPKAIGLLLQAYVILWQSTGDEQARATADALFEWLRDHTSEGYRGACWGYNFDWASPVKYLPAYAPSSVVTGFVCQGLDAYYQATGREEAATLLRSACDFVLHDLPRTEKEAGLSISYTPIMQDVCYNASLLGAEVLMRAHAITGEPELWAVAQRAVDYVVAQQHEDGHWNYSLDESTGHERVQIDFHQGYVIDSLQTYLDLAGAPDATVWEAIRKGATFYRNEQFFPSGRAKWRLPHEWPVDIHNQTQGILTFARLSSIDPAYLTMAETVAMWTIEHMQDPAGFFYYRKYRAFTNKIAYMRWAQAWMMLALSTLVARHAADEGMPL